MTLLTPTPNRDGRASKCSRRHDLISASSMIHDAKAPVLIDDDRNHMNIVAPAWAFDIGRQRFAHHGAAISSGSL